jgi:hypothetical protein
MKDDICIFCLNQTSFQHSARGSTDVVCTKCPTCSRHYCITEKGYNLFRYPGPKRADPTWYVAYERIVESMQSEDMPVFGIDMQLS